MKISADWVRDFVDIPADDRQLGEDLTSAGLSVEGTCGVGERLVFDLEITPNRPDAMNHYGVARECSAIYSANLKPIRPKLPPAEEAAKFPIEVEDEQGCARFTARIIQDVKIVPSPKKIVERLGLIDQRGINNAVDATNYALWEMGKPTHVYDLDLLQGGKIVVRRSRQGETLKTLDGVERKLSPEDLVVADAKHPVGLAGVMGGFDTMITERTRNILIESAWWDPVTVRKMSKRHGLHTDASHRFERGADFDSNIPSCDRVAELILQSGGGRLVGEPVDVMVRRVDQAPIALRLSEARRILGKALDGNEIVRSLRQLGFEIIPEPGEDAEFTVHIPSWRLDVEREIDLIEEIARIHGYDNFPSTLPAYAGSVVEAPEAAIDEKVRTTLLSLGYNETISVTFLSREDAERFSEVNPIELANPLSAEASVMRTSLAPGMLEMLAYNLNRGNSDVRLFEAGNVFEEKNGSALEKKYIAMGATAESLLNSVPVGDRLDVSKSGSADLAEIFRSMKGDIEVLLGAFQYRKIDFAMGTPGYYHPARSARVLMDGAVAAQFGQIHPEIAAARKLKHEVFLAEIHVEQLYRHNLHVPQFQPLSRYPAVERDFSFVFDDSVVFANIVHAIRELGISELRSFVPVEIFRGPERTKGTYSILLRATFQSHERTLREDELAQWSARIIERLQSVGGQLRG